MNDELEAMYETACCLVRKVWRLEAALLAVIEMGERSDAHPDVSMVQIAKAAMSADSQPAGPQEDA